MYRQPVIDEVASSSIRGKNVLLLPALSPPSENRTWTGASTLG